MKKDWNKAPRLGYLTKALIFKYVHKRRKKMHILILNTCHIDQYLQKKLIKPFLIDNYHHPTDKITIFKWLIPPNKIKKILHCINIDVE